MSGNRNDWAVEVLTPTIGGKLVVGTGYPIGSDRVLTSLHVVSPQDLDTDKPIKVRLPEKDESWCEVSEVLWESDAQHDIAIVKAPIGVDKRFCATLERHRPAEGEDWKLFGFARISESGAARTGVGFSGTLEPSRTTAPLDLSVKSQTEKAEDYSGISGAAVFVADRIVGVIKSFNLGFRGRRLKATPVSEFFADDGFLMAAGYSGKASLVESVAKNAYPELTGEENAHAARHLLRSFELEETAWSRHGARSIIERCTTYDCGRLARHFVRVHQEYRREGGSLGGLKALYRFALAALPAAVHEAHQSGLDERLEGGREPYEIGNEPKAEVLMAAADRRAMIVKVREIPEEEIRSGRPFTNLRDFEPDLGIPPPADTGLQLSKMVDEIQKSLGMRVSNSEKVSEEDLKSDLKFVAEVHGLRYYILLSGELNTLNELARELRKRFPFLVVMVLSPDVGRDPQEKTDLIRSIYAMRFEIRSKEILG